MEKITLKIPGGMYVHVPSEVTTTFVGKVPSKASLALMQNGLFTDSLCKLYICDANLTQVCLIWQTRHYETLVSLKKFKSNLLYMRISGFQRLDGGTRMSFTPPYSDSSQRILLSVHSCTKHLSHQYHSYLFLSCITWSTHSVTTSYFSILDRVFCRHNVDCLPTFLFG